MLRTIPEEEGRGVEGKSGLNIDIAGLKMAPQGAARRQAATGHRVEREEMLRAHEAPAITKRHSWQQRQPE